MRKPIGCTNQLTGAVDRHSVLVVTGRWCARAAVDTYMTCAEKRSTMAELLEVKIPHSGSVENVEVSEWVVKVGAVVAEGDVLAEVSTDKVDTELEAPAAGRVVRLLVEDGDEVAVGTVVALLVDAGVSDDEANAALAAYSPA